MITREQIEDLRAGDRVRLTWKNPRHPEIVHRVEGPLTGDQTLMLGDYAIRRSGEPVYGDRRTLEVLERAPRPHYVNSDRAVSTVGDVCRDSRDHTFYLLPILIGRGEWVNRMGEPGKLIPPLTLLIDGFTGLPPERS